MAASGNAIIHGMWVGTELSRLELLTLHSFVRFGHEFHLWAYDDLTRYALPPGVRLRDAEEIIPRKDVFAKRSKDPETGVGRNSFGAPFSDLFRYKLLYEQGGIWADMDVTCLRPFDFGGEYAFRPHRIGVVGSILKCPKGSPLMRAIYEETAQTVDADTAWLTPNRILTRHVEEGGLAPFIVENMSNPDNWSEFILPLIERASDIPDDWYAIHWINEMWRTLDADAGVYRGRQLLDYVPDKNAPREGSTLWELYRRYGLIDPRVGPPGRAVVRTKIAKGPTPISVTQLREEPRAPTALNILLPSLVRGGAERSAIETISALRKKRGLTQHLYVLHRSRRQYSLPEEDSLTVTFGVHGADVAQTLRGFALEILKSASPIVYTHLIPVEHLSVLWDMGITTVPVIQNGQPAWNDPPSAFDVDNVPFVAAVSDAVAQDLRDAGCSKAVIAIRHELQRSFKPEVMARQRREIRGQYGIDDRTLLVGMVGQFKSQKAYTRAVRVLSRLNETVPARLMILGGWDHQYGGGRAAYEAACRRAVDLGVIADMIMPGDVNPVDPYLAAFDVFLNTSIHEGLSVALLEAIAAGCPVVTADAGGNREVLPGAGAVLVEDGADIEAYAQAILELAGASERVVPDRPVEPTLVPQVWTLLARHGIANSLARPGKPSGTLFITELMNIGGPQQSLVNLLAQPDCVPKRALCVLRGSVSDFYKARLDDAQVPVFSTAGASGVVDQVERVLALIDSLNIRNVCFWNARPEFKLLMAKILSVRALGLFDVSPGPMLFDELREAEPFGRRISLTTAQYFARLDGFVAKCASGVPAPEIAPDLDKIYVIPNGVSVAPSFIPLPPPEFLLPDAFEPSLAIGTCCRIVPDKRIEVLLDMMNDLTGFVPGVSLTIVGGPDQASIDYQSALVARARDELGNVLFSGEHSDVRPFLEQFRVFVMASEREGCPNAALEAMSQGVPIVATQGEAIAELITDGVNGFLVSSPAEMAARVAQILGDKRLRQHLSDAARDTAATRFSLEAMARSYGALFTEPSRKPVGVTPISARADALPGETRGQHVA